MKQVVKEDALPLDDSFFNLSQEENEFFKDQTGIATDEELKDHILRIQKKSYKVYPYPCIRRFDFLRLKISKHPIYPTLLNLGKEGGILLDIGCCFGNDIRKAISDGFPQEQIVGSDLRQEFWDLGRELFKTTPDKFHVPFICGDIFDDHVLNIDDEDSLEPGLLPTLRDLRSLKPLKHRTEAIHAAAIFHLFDEEHQALLARRLASLLSFKKGSVIFGSHVGRPVKGLRTEAAGLGALGAKMFCHSDESWRSLWNDIFLEGTVKIDVTLDDMQRVDLRPKAGVKYYQLTWCITRL